MKKVAVTKPAAYQVHVGSIEEDGGFTIVYSGHSRSVALGRAKTAAQQEGAKLPIDQSSVRLMGWNQVDSRYKVVDVRFVRPGRTKSKVPPEMMGGFTRTPDVWQGSGMRVADKTHANCVHRDAHTELNRANEEFAVENNKLRAEIYTAEMRGRAYVLHKLLKGNAIDTHNIAYRDLVVDPGLKTFLLSREGGQYVGKLAGDAPGLKPRATPTVDYVPTDNPFDPSSLELLNNLVDTIDQKILGVDERFAAVRMLAMKAFDAVSEERRARPAQPAPITEAFMARLSAATLKAIVTDLVGSVK